MEKVGSCANYANVSSYRLDLVIAFGYFIAGFASGGNGLASIFASAEITIDPLMMMMRRIKTVINFMNRMHVS